MRRNKNRRKKRKSNNRWIPILIGTAMLAGVTACVISFAIKKNQRETPQELLTRYMKYIPQKEYENMYKMIEVGMSGNISEEDFIKRNAAIYEGIELQNMTVSVTNYRKEGLAVTYETTFDTVAGTIHFTNEIYFIKGEEEYKIAWNDALIFPKLEKTDKVKVSAEQAKRGEILDRNGEILAGIVTASSIGIVPGKLENRETTIKDIATLLDVTAEEIEKKLSAKWVKDEYFVPIKTVAKMQESELHEKLLAIPGIMISDTEVRGYPLEEGAAHLVGYVQKVTKEDLEEHSGEGYSAESVIGRSGMESLFEKELKGQNGCRIYIEDEGGSEKIELKDIAVEHGKNVKLTIDSKIQTTLYEQFKEDKSCSVAMNPYTGEVLALVSTPSYDNNDFIFGMSQSKWTSLNENEEKPLYNRFRQVWSPGSTFKPITAAIGLESGAIDPLEDYGNVGLSWQKDASWGAYHVTTLHASDPVNLENALIYSDNIYFAKAALQIKADTLATFLKKFGFTEILPFEIKMAISQYSNTEKIETEIQLADSGYGQGEMLINPLHLACLYTAFCNEGNVIKPYLLYQEDAKPENWIPKALSSEVANTVLEGSKKVISDPNGTGYAIQREDVVLAGKTGTAEIKQSQKDTSGTELGWFAVYTAEKTAHNPILIVNMVEDVKGRGGSSYVVEKDKKVLESWFGVE